MHIKVDDTVEIISGADRSLRAKVLKVYPRRGKVLVEGAAKVYKHVRPNQKNPQGGRLSREMPIDMSNVMYVCQDCRAKTRTGSRVAEDGRKIRYCKTCGADQGALSPARK
ncbi:MAG: 50S ribosomal protein L24 [Pirellulaceae bacterium]